MFCENPPYAYAGFDTEGLDNYPLGFAVVFTDEHGNFIRTSVFHASADSDVIPPSGLLRFLAKHPVYTKTAFGRWRKDDTIPYSHEYELTGTEAVTFKIVDKQSLLYSLRYAAAATAKRVVVYGNDVHFWRRDEEQIATLYTLEDGCLNVLPILEYCALTHTDIDLLNMKADSTTYLDLAGTVAKLSSPSEWIHSAGHDAFAATQILREILGRGLLNKPHVRDFTTPGEIARIIKEKGHKTWGLAYVGKDTNRALMCHPCYVLCDEDDTSYSGSMIHRNQIVGVRLDVNFSAFLGNEALNQDYVLPVESLSPQEITFLQNIIAGTGNNASLKNSGTYDARLAGIGRKLAAIFERYDPDIGSVFVPLKIDQTGVSILAHDPNQSNEIIRLNHERTVSTLQNLELLQNGEQALTLGETKVSLTELLDVLLPLYLQSKFLDDERDKSRRAHQAALVGDRDYLERCISKICTGLNAIPDGLKRFFRIPTQQEMLEGMDRHHAASGTAPYPGLSVGATSKKSDSGNSGGSAPIKVKITSWNALFNGSLLKQVGEFCQTIASDALSPQQKEHLTIAINVLLNRAPEARLLAENLGAKSQSLIDAIAAQYADAPDKMGAFLDALASNMEENYPPILGKSHNTVAQNVEGGEKADGLVHAQINSLRGDFVSGVSAILSKNVSTRHLGYLGKTTAEIDKKKIMMLELFCFETFPAVFLQHMGVIMFLNNLAKVDPETGKFLFRDRNESPKANDFADLMQKEIRDFLHGICGSSRFATGLGGIRDIEQILSRIKNKIDANVNLSAHDDCSITYIPNSDRDALLREMIMPSQLSAHANVPNLTPQGNKMEQVR